MQLGIFIGETTFSRTSNDIGSAVSRIARSADQAGLDSFWVSDHFMREGELDTPVLESHNVLAFCAGLTKTISLGALVNAAHHRAPGLLIKSISTLDVLSGGRAWLGIGAGWNELESNAFGIPFPELNARFEMLEETLQIAHHLWSDVPDSFQGKHYRLTTPHNRPQPLRQPHPPILIGGMGEQKTLRLVARYADACNFFSVRGFHAIQRRLDLLRQYCNEIQRDYDTIQRTVLYKPQQDFTIDQLLRDGKALADLGVNHLILQLWPSEHAEALLEQFVTQAAPMLREQ